MKQDTVNKIFAMTFLVFCVALCLYHEIKKEDFAYIKDLKEAGLSTYEVTTYELTCEYGPGRRNTYFNLQYPTLALTIECCLENGQVVSIVGHSTKRITVGGRDEFWK